MLHAARQPRSWLISDVSQRKVFFARILSMTRQPLVAFVVAGCAVICLASDPPVAGSRCPLPQPRPPFPFELYRAGVSGFAIVECVVDAEGNVASARVLDSSHEEFGRISVQFVRKQKLSPALKDGMPVVSTRQVTFSFKNPRAR